MILLGLMNNCPVKLEYVKIAEDIFGPSTASLKVKTTKTKPTIVVHNYIAVPKHI